MPTWIAFINLNLNSFHLVFPFKPGAQPNGKNEYVFGFKLMRQKVVVALERIR